MTTTTTDHAKWFDDAHRLIEVAKTPGLPLPQISATMADFRYTDITHPEDAREAVILAETILSHALRVEFEPRGVPRNGSSAYYVLSAYMPSGLRVDIVARAGIFDGAPVSREPIGAAAA